jgi:hypothetical protein
MQPMSIVLRALLARRDSPGFQNSLLIGFSGTVIPGAWKLRHRGVAVSQEFALVF